MFPYTISEDAVSVFVDGKPRAFPSSHASFAAIKDAILAGNEDMVRQLSDVKEHIAQTTFGRVKIFDNEIEVDGRVVGGKLVDRILEMVRLGSQAIEGYVAFLDNLMNNPRKCAVDELYEFIEACDNPITEDGCFLAYRFVDSDWKDMHSRSVFQKPADQMTDEELATYSTHCGVIGGKRSEVTTRVIDGVTTVSMPRNMVDDVRTNLCSEGLHFCSYTYLPSYGSGRHVMVVKINPADVVSIPEEYNLNKGRTWRYEVLTEIEDWREHQITPWFTDEYAEDDIDFDEDTGEIYDDEDELLDDLFDGDDDIDSLDAEVIEGLGEEYRDVTADVFGEDTVNTVLGTPEAIDTSEADYSKKLTWDQVKHIRHLFSEGEDTLTDIANAYGISRRQAARIRDRESWTEES